MTRMIEKVTRDMREDRLQADLEKYRRKALAMGAAHAVVLSARDIVVDERVPVKCQIPRCFGYGAGAHCPPHTMKPVELQELLKKYNSAVFFLMKVRPEVIVRDKTTIKERVAAYQQVFKIVSELESMAFYDGHYLAFGFGAGSCRHTYCGQQENCQALEGKRCRFSLLARPSMEAVGIDVYKMAAGQDWDIYPIGSGVKPAEIPHGTLAGIVIIQ